MQAWTTARSESNFAKFAPVLEEWVSLIKETSALIDPSRPAYDVALEEFEKGMTSARIDDIFTQASMTVHPQDISMTDGCWQNDSSERQSSSLELLSPVCTPQTFLAPVSVSLAGVFVS